MKYLAIFLPIILLPINAHSLQNPMFAYGTQNSIMISVGQSTGQGNLGKLVAPWEWDMTPATITMIQYSQPITILRLPARINISGGQNFAYHSMDGASFGAIGVSWDILLAARAGFYFGIGIGPYMRDSGDKYVKSRLVFGEKVFIGKNITNKIRAEFFTLHFSNGDFTNPNHGFNFTGLGINYSF